MVKNMYALINILEFLNEMKMSIINEYADKRAKYIYATFRNILLQFEQCNLTNIYTTFNR